MVDIVFVAVVGIHVAGTRFAGAVVSEDYVSLYSCIEYKFVPRGS